MSTIKIELGTQLPADLKKDFIHKMYYSDSSVGTCAFDEKGTSLLLDLKEGTTCIPDVLEKKARELAASLSSSYIPIKKIVYFDQSDITPRYCEDIEQVLLDQGHIHQLGQGQYALGPNVTNLIRALDSLFIEFGRSQGAREYAVPTLIPVETLAACDYFTSFPHTVTFAFHLPEDLKRIEDFMASAREQRSKGGIKQIEIEEVKTDVVLSPAVCYHIYHMQEDLSFDKGEQGRTFLCKGKCFRYESGTLNGLERMWDFTMREVVFVGSNDYVQSGRERSLDWVIDLLKQLGLKCRVETASDPFFAGDAVKKKAFQQTLQLKYEILVDLPWKDTLLAVGSMNIHQNFFGKTFNISLENGTHVETGCTAFGLERFALAVMAQYGPEPEHWPEILTSRMT